VLLTLGTMINLIPLYLFGKPETTTIFSGYIGFLALGMACLAVGQLFSALTQNQIVAALATICVLLGFWFVGYLQGFQQSYELRTLFRHLSFSLHYANFVQGLVRTESLAFYAAVCAIALTINASYLDWRR
jgi:ABC-2 type transport system permease protein